QERAERARELALVDGGFVAAGDSGGRDVVVPEELVLLPEGKGVPSRPGGHRALLVLHEVAIEHELEVVAPAIVGGKCQVGRLLAVRAARADTGAGGPVVVQLVVRVDPGAHAAAGAIRARDAGGI